MFYEVYCQHLQKADQIDLVFDSYIEGSVKDAERIRRCKSSPIELSDLQKDTPLPVLMERFWSSPANKAKLQLLLRHWIVRNCLDKWPNTQVYVSGTFSESVEKCMRVVNGSGIIYQELDSGTEEADLRIIHHAANAGRNDATMIVVLSGDTDRRCCPRVVLLVTAADYWLARVMDERWCR